MTGQDIKISASEGGTFDAYLALPESGSGPGVVISSGLLAVGNQAWGFLEATSLKRLIRAPTRRRCVSRSRPRCARSAFSKIG